MINSDSNIIKKSYVQPLQDNKTALSEGPSSENEVIIKILNSINVLDKMNDVLASTDPPDAKKSKLIKMNHTLFKPAMGIERFQHADWKSFISTQKLSLSRILDIKKSEDVGGHGGNLMIKVSLTESRDDFELSSKTHYLFLKPYDEIEHRNYQIIKEQAPEVSEFMPQIYGDVMIDATRYLVMQNTRFDSAGRPLNQLADIKIAGKIPNNPDFNPIADQNEIKTTRGSEKNYIDYMQMKFGAESAPDYMLSVGPKLFRIFQFRSSESNLLEKLDNISVDHLKFFREKLEKLSAAIEQSPIAFIGASVILIREYSGEIRPLLIDPAHIQVHPGKKSEVENQFKDPEITKRIYFGEEQGYSQRKESNKIGLKALKTTVITELAKNATDDILAQQKLAA